MPESEAPTRAGPARFAGDLRAEGWWREEVAGPRRMRGPVIGSRVVRKLDGAYATVASSSMSYPATVGVKGTNPIGLRYWGRFPYEMAHSRKRTISCEFDWDVVFTKVYSRLLSG